MNTGRRLGKVRDEGLQLCCQVAAGGMCDHGDQCRINHDIPAYLATQPPDLGLPQTNDIDDMPMPPPVESGEPVPSTSYKTICPIFKEMGVCRFGFRCRYLSAHSNNPPSRAKILQWASPRPSCPAQRKNGLSYDDTLPSRPSASRLQAPRSPLL
ncbi:hypothetical protein C8F01DRAFT_1139269 [Mycena amicta]|nr:hypothetical protein C8F01DRAFT_1139269 [Mycena amicta]